uniref:CSON015077 protein n=1 Tax=Culicoides sonorensis TaxID=179676 RepID=A0A336MCB5_CULSO
MEETVFSETKLLMKENVRKYGSISSASGKNSRNQNISYIRHEIQQNDTLQGIALKYGVSMEQIKRTNRLLTTDTIFLRQYLMIPVPIDSPVNSGSADVRRAHSLDVQYIELPFPSNDTSTGSSTVTASSSMTSCRSSEPSQIEPDPDEDIENFLSKVDSSIASTKKIVEQTRKQSDILAKIQETSDDVDGNLSYNNGNESCNGSSRGTTFAGTRRKCSYEGAYQNFSNSVVTDDINSSRSNSNSRRSNSRRHIKNSFHRLEQQQDELFEL